MSFNCKPENEEENRPMRDDKDVRGGFLRRSLWPAKRLRQLRFT